MIPFLKAFHFVPIIHSYHKASSITVYMYVHAHATYFCYQTYYLKIGSWSQQVQVAPDKMSRFHIHRGWERSDTHKGMRRYTLYIVLYKPSSYVIRVVIL